MHKTGQRYGPPTALWCDSSSHSSLAAFDLKNLLNNSHLSGGFVDDDDSTLGAQHALLNTFWKLNLWFPFSSFFSFLIHLLWNCVWLYLYCQHSASGECASPGQLILKSVSFYFNTLVGLGNYCRCKRQFSALLEPLTLSFDRSTPWVLFMLYMGL